ncbi:MAG TPA: glycoside hydrolase family 20 zincin-like fold domain-containing protein [Candidatus Hydrogenedentes bacterium]|nr:glycoside hydrolase family 20 zincin-like fold domain-containing protein [Candidatus Hydrogenedentota bacterium]HRT21374.1 glycoside hydrolase family 20 zincin-like fold domain-containing protein [Candidatus Hydrogenedentota bacterium]HRT65919.1 glycoside hydrolase family 20 zincin-like fold domain-containing protein [Candidatus Hydrogenedentota bacterium]
MTGSLCLSGVICFMAMHGGIDLTKAVVVAGDSGVSTADRIAARVLIEEVKARTGLEWTTTDARPPSGPSVEIGFAAKDLPPEAYRLSVDADRGLVRIEGADRRGALYGVGDFLRKMDWAPGRVTLPVDLAIETRPAYAIRGHQLGYRHTANSYDAWDEARYDRYIRELALFGANAVENIPFQDESSPVMPVTRERMNIAMSEICERYGLDYWIWTPVEADLADPAVCAEALDMWEAFYRTCPRLDAVFFPGGDPGDNAPQHVMPFLEQAAQRLRAHHPKATMWISLQGFERDEVDWFFAYMNEKAPEWLAGVVHGPQSPPLAETRQRLAKTYRLRAYPDITHTILCQFPVPWWDPAFALTEGRECVNPRPRFYARVHNRFAPYTDGFLSYSDGVHDDVNKIVWTLLAWDPDRGVRDMLIEYARFFFGPGVAADAADAILALETNWEGSAALNGAIDAVWARWQAIEARAPELRDNWRWRLLAFRAAYDAYVRGRLLHETALEQDAHTALARAVDIGADAAMDAAEDVLRRAGTDPACAGLRARLETDGEDLFRQIGMQMSVEKYHARNFERGAVLDFLDRPLNNRWWLEDQFARIRALPDEAAKCAELDRIRTWENPVPGSRYDVVGDTARNPHVLRGEPTLLDVEDLRAPLPGYGTWLGPNRWRLSWLSSLDWPIGVVYEGIDTQREYVVRTTGRGESLLKINGARVQPARYDKELGGIKEFPVPRAAVATGKITLTWDAPDEAHLNWRHRSFLSEVWLLPR